MPKFLYFRQKNAFGTKLIQSKTSGEKYTLNHITHTHTHTHTHTLRKSCEFIEKFDKG